MRLNKLYLAVSVALMMSSGAVWAQAQQGTTQQNTPVQPQQQQQQGNSQQAERWAQGKFQEMDKDKDGYIVFEELDKSVPVDFVVADTDFDQRLSQEEFLVVVRDTAQQNPELQARIQQDQQQGQQQAQSTQQGGAEGAQIEVQQPRAQINVQQSQPQVTVQQPAPEIQVQQPQPEVTVRQAQPEVIVRQAQPEVIVRQPQPEVTVQQAQPEVTVQQAQPEVTVQQAKPEVTVQQAQPEVTVQQAKPEVTVQQPRPEVTVQQPRPEVTVQQAQPEVQVQQAQPEVTVQQAQPEVQVQQAEAQVSVEQQEQARVMVEKDVEANVVSQQDQQRTQQATQTQPVTVAVVEVERVGGQQAWMNSPLYSMRVEDVVGREVINLEGQEIGDIEELVIDPSTNEMLGVVSVGGFLGIGDKEITVSLSEIQMVGDRLMLDTTKSEDQLETRPAYEPSRYQRITGAQGTLAELYAGQQGGTNTTAMGGGDRFTQLDMDRSGDISMQEAQQESTLSQVFQNLDTNNNQRLDQSEFAQFEMNQLRE